MNMKGKILPHVIEIEKAVLGALLIDMRVINEIGDILLPEMFYIKAHQKIYRAILKLNSQSIGCDMMTVSNHLRTDKEVEKIGGDLYIVKLTQRVASSAHCEYHARIIIQKYIQRQLIKKSTEIIENAYNDENDVFDLLDNAYNNLNDISEKSIKTQETLLADLIDKQLERAQKIYRKEIKAGLTTPIKNLTEKTGGWRDSELIVLAARPGMGKTAFAVLCALHSAKQNIPTAIFSLEMSKEKLTDRILSMEAKVRSEKFNIHGLGEYDMERIKPVEGMLKNIPLHIDDEANLTIVQFQIKAKRLKNKFGVKFIIVDYLQLMTGDGKSNREQEISKISRGLKITAKELNIPIMALSQLSRAVESRGGTKRPLLSDLRESGAIEQDADMVGFLYRPEYYGITEWDGYDQQSTLNEAEYIIAKNRNGGLVKNRMKFEGIYTLFSDLDNGPQINDIDYDSQNSSEKKDDDMPF